MRLLEWVLLLSFIPTLLIPFTPQTWRQHWLFTSVLLPPLASGLHLAVEGWRVQMIPLYALTVMVLAGRLPRRDSIPRRRPGMLVIAGTALMLVFSGILAGWLMPVVTLPEPTGPYPVGIVDRELVDKTRGRRLMVSVWYPAAYSGELAPLTHYPDEMATALGDLSGLPGLAFQHLRYTRLAASNDVPISAKAGPFPVLVFSHGMVGLRLQNSSTLQELASWGYVVVAIDHTDAAAVTVFPDGEARFYNLAPFGIPSSGVPDKASITERVFPVWVADQRFVYDMLEKWAVNDALLAGELDLNRVGSFGHSFGGATALEVCRIDSRCRAAANLDGGLYGQTATQPAVRPLMLMSSVESSQYSDAVEGWRRLVENADAEAYWLELPRSTHFSFTITQLISPILEPENFDPRAGLQVVDKVLQIFFEIHLRGRDVTQAGLGCSKTEVRWLTRSPCE